jgi:hypothetical protein
MQDVQEIVSVIRDGLDDAELAKTIKRCVITNTWRLRSILKMVEMKDIIIRTPIAIVPTSCMDMRASSIDERAGSYALRALSSRFLLSSNTKDSKRLNRTDASGLNA